MMAKETKHYQLDLEKRFAEIQAPSMKDENYKFSPLADFNWALTPALKSGASLAASKVRSAEMGFDLSLSSSAPSVSIPKNLEDGVICVDWATAFDRYGSLVTKALDERSKQLDDDKLSLLAESRSSAGYFLYVDKTLARPLHSVHFLEAESDRFLFWNLIYVNSSAELQFIEEFCGDEERASKKAQVVGRSDLVLSKSSKLKYFQIQNWPSVAEVYFRQSMGLYENSSLQNVVISLGARKGQVRTSAECFEEGANLHFYNSVRASKRQHFDFWVESLHRTRDTKSHLNYWTLAEDSSRTTFNGMIDISIDGARTEASQKCRNLLLSDKAIVDVLPNLKIATDDVQVSHGASVSSIEEDQLFYLMSRGLDRDEAQKLIIEGFAEPIISMFPLEDVQDALRKLFLKGAAN